MPQPNPQAQPAPTPQDSDAKDAYEAFKAYKAFKAKQSQLSPDAADKSAHNGTAVIPSPNPDQQGFLSKVANAYGQYKAGLHSGMIKSATLGGYDPDPQARQGSAPARIGGALGQAGGGLLPGMAIGSGAGALAGVGEMAGLAGTAARAGVNAGAAGLQKYLSNRVQNAEDPTQGVGTDMLVGGGISAGAEGLGSLLRGGANSSMKRAVGLVGAQSKNAPANIGNRIVDEGIWGTKSGMANQVADKYVGVENDIQGLAKSLDGSVSADSLAATIENKAARHLNPETGKPVSGGESAYATKQGIASNVRKGGAGYSPGTPAQTTTSSLLDNTGNPVTSTTPGTPATPGKYGGEGLLKLKRAGDEEAFNQSGLVGNSYAAEGYKAQADAARQGLSSLSDGAMPDLLKREQTLIYANKGLSKPTMTYKNPVSLTDIGAGIVGSNSHGLPGAGSAVLASKAVAAPIIQSLFAHGAQRVAAPVEALKDPAILQSLFSLKNAAGQ